MNEARVIVGDCRLVMAEMPECSVDAIVCDPPYDLLSASRNGSGRSNEPNNPYGRHGSNGGGFMGMKWDATGVAFDPETWRITMRVLKPGGHLAAFGGTRTFHRLTCAIEDAGFEIRDVLSWLYGSGFPKSLDVSKAIDKAAGAERGIVGRERNWGASSTADGKVAYGDYAGEWNLSTPATVEAQLWRGWGTALKPAWEPIVLARKPLSEPNVAANVLRWGTGALNIDGCRIASEDDYVDNRVTQGINTANVTLNEEAAELLDEKSGTLTSGANPTRRATDKFRGIYAAFPGQAECEPARGVDVGGASRFFYTAKASRSERNERAINRHPTVKPIALLRWLCRLVTPPHGHVLDPFAGSGSTLVAALQEGFSATGIELSAEYAKGIADQRIDGVQIGGLV